MMKRIKLLVVDDSILFREVLARYINQDDMIEIVVQINGKLKTKLMVSADADKDTVLASAMQEEKVKEALDGKNVLKQIYVPNKLVNFVAK